MAMICATFKTWRMSLKEGGTNLRADRCVWLSNTRNASLRGRDLERSLATNMQCVWLERLREESVDCGHKLY